MDFRQIVGTALQHCLLQSEQFRPYKDRRGREKTINAHVRGTSHRTKSKIMAGSSRCTLQPARKSHDFSTFLHTVRKICILSRILYVFCNFLPNLMGHGFVEILFRHLRSRHELKNTNKLAGRIWTPWLVFTCWYPKLSQI